MPHPETPDDSRPTRGDRASVRYPGTPLWVKVSAIIVVVLVLLVGLVLVTGIGGTHGPMRHAPSSNGDAVAHALVMAI
jgi:hypothetical protein